jgi:hypothetical protein
MRRPELFITKHMMSPSFEHSASAESGVSLPLISTFSPPFLDFLIINHGSVGPLSGTKCGSVGPGRTCYLFLSNLSPYTAQQAKGSADIIRPVRGKWTKDGKG